MKKIFMQDRAEENNFVILVPDDEFDGLVGDLQQLIQDLEATESDVEYDKKVQQLDNKIAVIMTKHGAVKEEPRYDIIIRY